MKCRLIFGLIITAGLFLFQGCFSGAFYHPNQVLFDSPTRYQLSVEDVFFESRDGTRLHGWFVPAVGERLGTVIHFHGNYGNLTYSFKQVHWLPAKGFNVFTFDYRGYGRSAGKPSKRGVYEDSVAAIDYILNRTGVDPDNVFVFGQSLGAVNAMVALSRNDFTQIRAVAAEGAFDYYRAEARERMEAGTRKTIGNVPCLSLQIWPLAFLAVTDSYSPGDHVQRISPVPLLLIHCLQDSIVYYQHSERLYEAARAPKHLWLIDGCGHIEVFSGAQDESGHRQKLVQFFLNYRKGALPPLGR